MTYSEFYALVNSYVNKSELIPRIPSFVATAKVNLQRKHDFNFSRVDAQTTYPATADVGITLNSNFKGLTGQNAVRILSGTVEMPLVGSTLETERRRLNKTTVGTLASTGVVQSFQNYDKTASLDIRYYIKILATGIKLFTYPEQLTQVIRYEYFSWLPTIVSDNSTDYLLSFGHDVLLWETLKVSNMMLAEENRVLIDNDLARAAFDDFVNYDNGLSLAGSFIDVS